MLSKIDQKNISIVNMFMIIKQSYAHKIDQKYAREIDQKYAREIDQK